jgi:hypothetical protein
MSNRSKPSPGPADRARPARRPPRLRWPALAGLALLLGSAAPAAAQPADTAAAAAPSGKVDSWPPHRVVASLPLLAISSSAIAFQLDRPVARQLSVAVSLGLRRGAHGDYHSTALALGGELRLWLRPRQRGWFAAPRLEAAVTWMSMEDTSPGELAFPDHSLGTEVLVTEGLAGGYRLVLFDRVELTPAIGLAYEHDLPSGDLAATGRFTATGSLSLGWVF